MGAAGCAYNYLICNLSQSKFDENLGEDRGGSVLVMTMMLLTCCCPGWGLGQGVRTMGGMRHVLRSGRRSGRDDDLKYIYPQLVAS